MLSQISPLYPPSKFSLKNLPWATFLVVLLLHGFILWWLMGAFFGQIPETLPEPIFVTLEHDDSSESGPAETAPDADTALDKTSKQMPASASEKYPLPTLPDSKSKDARLSDPSAEQEADIAVELSEEIRSSTPTPENQAPVVQTKDSQVNQKTVVINQKTALTSSSQAAPRSNSIKSAPKPELPVAEPREGSGSIVSDRALSQDSAASFRSTGPLIVSRVDYLGDPPRPIYPSMSKSRKQQGKVVVRVLISTEGQINSIRLQQTSGFDPLDQSALDAFRQIRFKPYAVNGIAQERQVDIPIEFVLRN